LKKIFSKYKLDIIINILFILIYFFIVLFITKNGKYIMGSYTDFDVQYYNIPDYLRTLFYSSHNLLPTYSFNLGAGTNIFNLAYYGLFNPIILISYLFPFIKMLDYILISMSIIVLVSTSLFYFYLRKHNYSYLISFIGAFLFLCASPIIYHSHRHIMFISYFPFLILGLYGIDRFIDKKKSLLLIVSIIFMIFTSYYYSVSGLVVLFLFGLYRMLKKKKFNFKSIFSLIIRMIIPIIICSILIIPTLDALLSGRSISTNSYSLIDFIKPNIYLLYSPYSIGLTIISLISLVFFAFSKDKANKYLSIILLICCISPIPNYILNGFLYIEPKSLIPFIVLILLLVCEFLSIICKMKFNKILISYILLSSLLVCLHINSTDQLIIKDSLNTEYYKNYNNIVNSIINKKDIYRINSTGINKSYINRVGDINELKTTSYLSSNNMYYKNVYQDLFQNPIIFRNNFSLASSNNLLFEMYMGERDLLTKKNLSNYYNKINNYSDVVHYRNDYVLPIGYSTSEVININDFNKLDYPSNVYNMMGRVVNNNKTNVEFRNVDVIDTSYKLIDYSNLKFKKINNNYEIIAEDNASMRIKINKDNDDLLVVGFKVDDNYKCMKNDKRIIINGIHNVLTCHNWKYYNNNTNFYYTFSSNENEFNIKFNKGTYKISNLSFYYIDSNDLKNINNNIDKFKIKSINNNKLIGSINVLKDGYFTISIPYDKNFNIYVDNKKIDYKLVNKAFIGFPINKGKHIIKLVYNNKYLDIGIVLSILGLLSLLVLVIYEKRKN